MFKSLQEILHIEKFGRLTTLLPIKVADPFLQSKWGSKPLKKSQYSKMLALISLIIILCDSAWDWDSLKLSYFHKNSDKIHYATFQLAIWISSTIGRLAFLIAAPQFHTFLQDAQAYLREYVVEPTNNEGQGEAKKNKNQKFKMTGLISLNFIFVAQFTEFSYRHFYNKTESPLNQHCEHILLPCPNHWINKVLLIIFKLTSSLTLYFLTYFVVTMSHLLMLVLSSFKRDILSRIQLMQPDVVGVDLDLDFNMVSPLFILKDGGQSKEQIERKMGNKDKPKDFKAMTDLHEQFSRIKGLFSKFNCALGPPLIITCLGDVLVFICIVFTLVPKLESGNLGKGGYLPGLGPEVPPGFSTGWINNDGGGGILPDQGQYNPGGDPVSPPPLSGPLVHGGFEGHTVSPRNGTDWVPQSQGQQVGNGTEANEGAPSIPYNAYGPQSTSPGLGMPNMHEPGGSSSLHENQGSVMGFGGGFVPDYHPKVGVGTGDGKVSRGFFYVFAILYECRAILLALIGSILKWKVSQLKQVLEDRVQRCGIGSRNNMRMSSFEEEEEMTMIDSVVARVDKWHWQLRPMDMINVDLSLLPAMLGTVMTYVVVLLQIQISEGN